MMKGLLQEVILITVVITSSLIIVNMITPTIDSSTSFQDFNRAKETMTVLDSVIRELLVEGKGATRSVQIISDFGSFTVSDADDRIFYEIETDAPILDPGTVTQEGNLIITAGAGMKAYIQDINSDTHDDLILENDAIKFAVNKTGTSTSWVAINTTTFITQITNKLTSTDITPTSGVFFGDALSTSYGNGYTQLSQQGNDLSSASITAFINASSGEQYNVIFTLRSTTDFVEIEVIRLV
jgi:uncharacterized protein YqkB